MNALCEEQGIKGSFENLAFGFNFIFFRNNDVRANVLSENEIFAFHSIQSNIKISKAELSEKPDKNGKTVQRICNSLINKGYIKK